MKKKTALIPILAVAAAALACNLETAAGPTLSADQINTLSAQTLAMIQWQTYSAQQPSSGGTPGGAMPTAGPADTATNTILPTVTWTGTQLPSATFTPTVTTTPLPCNWVQFVSDVTIPDNWETTPSDHFTKTWRLRNIGSCTWTSGYSLVFDHGDQMGAPASQQLTTGTVAPGATIDVSVDLVSPAAAGTYQGFFKLRASDSSVFGIGPSADTAFWVKIVVIAPTGPVIQQVSANTTIHGGSTGSTTAVCPAGTVVTGGGFSTGTDVLVYTQAKNGNGWVAVAKNNFGADRTLTVYAECLTYPSASTVMVDNTVSVNAGSYASQTAVCPAGSVVTGGGYTSSPDGSMWVYANWQVGNNWQVSERNYGGSPKTFHVYAVCLSGTPLTTVRQDATGNLPASGNGFVAATCPAGRVATGGGWGLSNDELPYYSGYTAGAWRVYAHNSSASVRSMLAMVTCLG
ncbi:MAG: hypothetical protein JW929_06390 [Anaerolineales bacterium]|nr:hypothetical protein [Anaerolineales bacterium]